MAEFDESSEGLGDLVENTGGALYRITDRGRAYLAGELNANDLPPKHEQ